MAKTWFLLSVMSILLVVQVQCYSMAAAETNIHTDQSSLVALKSYITYDPKNILAKDWSNSIFICNWTGVTCGLHHNQLRVVSLNLSYMGLVGTVPPHLGNLSFLVNLTARNNSLQGNLPNELSNLSQLKLINFGFNDLTGEIPSWLGSLPKLALLRLYGNRFTGSIPNTICNLTSVEEIDLSYNQLSGSIPKNMKNLILLKILDLSYNYIEGSIPKEIRNLTLLKAVHLGSNKIEGDLELLFNKFDGPIPRPGELLGFDRLEYLDLSDNQFQGDIPSMIGDLKSLTWLVMKGNNFSGEMPRTFLDGSSLKNLDLSHNQLEGTVPQSLIKCSALEVLNLGYNQLNDTFPFWLQDLKDLQVLSLRSNKFHGPIWKPKKFRGFVKLRIIDLSFNNFSGILSPNYFGTWSAINAEIPVANKSGPQYMGFQNGYYTVTVMNKGTEMVLKKILTIFTSIDLSNNNLYGEIPITIGDLQSLIVLNLSSNNFEGLISPSFGNLKELESLDLSNNKLSGRIPPELASLTFLAYLNLSESQLWGPIPQGGQINTFQSSSFEGNAELCGFPLSTKCESSDETPILDHEFESESGFGWKAVLMGYGCGFVVGIVYGRFIISKHPNLLTRIYGRKL